MLATFGQKSHRESWPAIVLPIVLYLVASMVFAAVLFIVVAGFRPAQVQAPGHPGLVSLIGGILWPLMLAGLLELAGLVAVRKVMGVRRPSVATHVLPTEPELLLSQV